MPNFTSRRRSKAGEKCEGSRSTAGFSIKRMKSLPFEHLSHNLASSRVPRDGECFVFDVELQARSVDLQSYLRRLKKKFSDNEKSISEENLR
jgi:hypothetical protein